MGLLSTGIGLCPVEFSVHARMEPPLLIWATRSSVQPPDIQHWATRALKHRYTISPGDKGAPEQAGGSLHSISNREECPLLAWPKSTVASSSLLQSRVKIIFAMTEVGQILLEAICITFFLNEEASRSHLWNRRANMRWGIT